MRSLNSPPLCTARVICHQVRFCTRLASGCWPKMASEETVYCLCRQPYDETRFMIECNVCKDWFHGTYVYSCIKGANFVSYNDRLAVTFVCHVAHCLQIIKTICRLSANWWKLSQMCAGSIFRNSETFVAEIYLLQCCLCIVFSICLIFTNITPVHIDGYSLRLGRIQSQTTLRLIPLSSNSQLT